MGFIIIIELTFTPALTSAHNLLTPLRIRVVDFFLLQGLENARFVLVVTVDPSVKVTTHVYIPKRIVASCQLFFFLGVLKSKSGNHMIGRHQSRQGISRWTRDPMIGHLSTR